MTTRILFVCLGNICRSPTAHGVFETLAAQAGADVVVESAGTGGWHVGDPPDRRATAEAAKRGYDLSHLRAQQVTAADFARFDLIVAMDHSNLAALERMRPIDSETPVELFLSYAQTDYDEVPDPYYSGGFDLVLDLIEEASRGLLATLARQG
ncbi:low molecular weight protein-tyrosine-phosphatase [Actibacterium sp. XHP0104]|uniref:low molecular weight protein-tyrosine-phosphatase n=1 Tax=Actibacterium sp. XHP0104 TaxID=2984335 RepID=UPI0021E89355|nr:low molecular weight protein-tyrosine-phosphatase [Actibacterium sp. XHP0104]MCV2882924.1 low molecular weight phosphotyrosine protein phosphatase [Actibacterium sp. XHP0104]